MNKRRCFFLSGLILILSISRPLGAEPQDPGTAFSGGLVFHVPSHQEAEPGDFVTYVFPIDNESGSEKSFRVSAVSSLNWPLLTSGEEASIPPGKKGLFAVSVLIPEAAYGGTEDPLTVTFTSRDLSTSYTLTTRVMVTCRFRLIFPEKIAGQPGEVVRIPVTLRNQGSVSREFSFLATSETRWRVGWEITGCSLAPGEELVTHVQCVIPVTAVTGSSDTIYLLVKTEDKTEEYRLTMLVKKTALPVLEKETFIPVHSNVSLSLLSPTEPGDVYNWETAVGLSGDIHPLLHFNFYLAGESRETLFSPSALLLGLTGSDWYMQTGRFAAGWPGLIPSPSTAANLYLQSRRSRPFSLWLGAGRDFISPTWLGGLMSWPEKNLRLALLVPLEETRFDGVLEARYTPPAFRSARDWRLSYQHALGLGVDSLLHQGELSLQKRGPDWRLSAALTAGDEFSYFEDTGIERFAGIDLQTEHTLSPRLTFEPGVTYRIVAAQDNESHSSFTLHSKLSSPYAYLLLYHQQDLTAATEQGLQLSLSNSRALYEGAAAFSWSRKPAATSVGFYGRLRRFLYASSYLETSYEQRWENGAAGFSSPYTLGLRWSHLLYSNWENYGSIYYHHPAGSIAPYITLQAATGYWLSPGTFLQLRATGRWEDNSAGPSRIDLSILRRDLFLLPAPWGNVEGRVFLDLNRNGRYDPVEPGIPGITILLDGAAKTTTDTDGLFALPRLEKGDYKLTLVWEEKDFYLPDESRAVTVEPNRAHFVNIPALPALEIKGLAFLDKNKNHRHEVDEPVVGGVKLLVYSTGSDDLFTTARSDRHGFFYLTGLLPGSYRLEAGTETLPAFTFTEPLTIMVQDHPHPLVLFPLWEEEREIEFTFVEELEGD